MGRGRRPARRLLRLPLDEVRQLRGRVHAREPHEDFLAAAAATVYERHPPARRQLDATTSTTAAAAQADDGGIPIDVDLSSSRRLTVTVDFVPGNGIGGAVRFANPIIER
ncbi:MAG: hypothetical protein ACKOHK_12695 [Planctomycetia bacterium]